MLDHSWAPARLSCMYARLRLYAAPLAHHTLVATGTASDGTVNLPVSPRTPAATHDSDELDSTAPLRGLAGDLPLAT
jgi:hypothetical protein